MPGKIDASLDEKLQTVQWGEYRIGELFDSETGDFDIQKKHINDSGEYVITSGLTNNGVLGKSDIRAKIFKSNTITVDMFGNVFFRPFKYKIVTHARVFTLICKFQINLRQGLFLVNSFKYLSLKFGYENMCSWAKIQDDIVLLPTKDGKIDFQFMETFVAELEARRIAELEAYLSITGLDNYELTDDERQALEKINSSSIEFVNLPIIDVFDIKNTKCILAKDVRFVDDGTPYITAGVGNNSVAGYVEYDKKLIDKGNCVFIGGKTFVVTYQAEDFYSNDSHNLALYNKKLDVINKMNQLYLATCVRKSLQHKYSWGDSVSNKKIINDYITVPMHQGAIDYHHMNLLISAVQKLVIKDVILYAKQKENLRKTIIK